MLVDLQDTGNSGVTILTLTGLTVNRNTSLMVRTGNSRNSGSANLKGTGSLGDSNSDLSAETGSVEDSGSDLSAVTGSSGDSGSDQKFNNQHQTLQTLELNTQNNQGEQDAPGEQLAHRPMNKRTTQDYKNGRHRQNFKIKVLDMETQNIS